MCVIWQREILPLPLRITELGRISEEYLVAVGKHDALRPKSDRPIDHVIGSGPWERAMVGLSGAAIFDKFVVVRGIHDKCQVAEALDHVADQVVFQHLGV
jgi:hypothetical protein